jgi:hypothetical protein
MATGEAASAPTRQRKPRPKPRRFARLCIRLEGMAPGIVRLTVGTNGADYFLTELPAGFGRGFLVEKVGIDRDTAKYRVHTRQGGRLDSARPLPYLPTSCRFAPLCCRLVISPAADQIPAWRELLRLCPAGRPYGTAARKREGPAP